jgi:hypothetical protein
MIEFGAHFQTKTARLGFEAMIVAIALAVAEGQVSTKMSPTNSSRNLAEEPRWNMMAWVWAWVFTLCKGSPQCMVERLSISPAAEAEVCLPSAWALRR